MDKTTTRSTLSEAVFKNVGFLEMSQPHLLIQFLEKFKKLINGDDVKISSFGTFVVRQKKKELVEIPRQARKFR